jgi:single-stranded DNA-specific DHH superfamily exonuclease
MTNQIMNPSMQFLELVSKDSQDIFNYYIYKQQLEDLNVEQKQLLEYMIENNTTLPKDLDISNNPIIDKSNEIESMKNIIDLLKKQNRKLKNLQKKVIKQQLE